MSMTKAEVFEVIRYYASKEFDNIPKRDSEINYDFSDEFNIKMDNLIKKESRKHISDYSGVIRAAAIVAAVAIIFISGLLSIKSIRKPAVEFVYNIYEHFVQIVFKTSENHSDTTDAESVNAFTTGYYEQTTANFKNDFSKPYSGYINGTTAPNTNRDITNSIEKKESTTKVIAPPPTTQFVPVRTVFQKDNMYYMDDKYYVENIEKYNYYSSLIIPFYYLDDPMNSIRSQIEVDFTYEGKDWLIVSTKESVKPPIVSTETVIMTAPEGKGFADNNIDNYRKYIPDEKDWLKIQFEVFDFNNSLLFKIDYEPHWWANGYINIADSDATPEELEALRLDEITVRNRITLKDSEMSKQFAEGLGENGLEAVQDESDLSLNTYYINGNEVIYIF